MSDAAGRHSRASLPRIAAAAALCLASVSCAAPRPRPLEAPDPPSTPELRPGAGLAITVQERTAPALLSRGGVLGSGVGVDRDGRHVIRVYTLHPDPPNLPIELDGVALVPVPTGWFVAGTADGTTTAQRPAPNGFSVGHPRVSAGSIGAIVKDALGERFILSNNHVLADDNEARIGDPIYQPGVSDGGTAAHRIGALSAYRTIRFSDGVNTMDAAIARIEPGAASAATPLHAYGAPGSMPAVAFVGQAVQKFGRTTEHTTGSVAETHVTADVCYEFRAPFHCARFARFVDQITIADAEFSDSGDSGSLVVTDNPGRHPVGLLFAGSESRSMASPIGRILRQFGVTITGDPGGSGNRPPTASFTALCRGLRCVFDGRGSSDPDGTIATRDWAFGDGTVGGGALASHTYETGGTYVVTLAVTDPAGDTDLDSRTVHVRDPAGGAFVLTSSGSRDRGVARAELVWSGARSGEVDVYRDGTAVATVPNSGFFTDLIQARGPTSYIYLVCEAATGICSNASHTAF